jgi:hypothetical protein
VKCDWCRILGMVDGCLLVVDVTEGPMAQTKFVVSKALAMGLHPLVVFNKVDRPTVSPTLCDLVHGQLFDLFSSLGATESQLDFPVLFASGVPLFVHKSSSAQFTALLSRPRCVIWFVGSSLISSPLSGPQSRSWTSQCCLRPMCSYSCVRALQHN